MVSRVCFGQKLKHPLPLLFTFTFISPNSLRPLSLSTYFSLLVSLNTLSNLSPCKCFPLSLSPPFLLPSLRVSLSFWYAHFGVYKRVYMYCIHVLCSCLSVYLYLYASPGFINVFICTVYMCYARVSPCISLCMLLRVLYLSVWVRVLIFFFVAQICFNLVYICIYVL